MAGSTTSQVEERTTPKGLEVHLPLKMKLALVAQEVTADEMHQLQQLHRLHSLSTLLFLVPEI